MSINKLINCKHIVKFLACSVKPKMATKLLCLKGVSYSYCILKCHGTCNQAVFSFFANKYFLSY